MNQVTRLVSRLLAALHRTFPFPLCHGDWLWTVALAGVVFALFPVAAAVLFALIRKFTGNHYAGGVAVVFGVLGLLGGAVLPWLGFRAVARLMDVGQLIAPASRSCFVTDQQGYFTAGHTVFAALTASSGGGALGIYAVALVGVPLIGLLFTALLARAAFRRGPRWPGRTFLWVPFALLFLGTLGLPANPVVTLWLGFVPTLLPGALLVVLFGAPPWSALDRRREPRIEHRPEPFVPPPPVPPPPAPAPTAVADRLADTPGPLPFPSGPPSNGSEPPAGDRFRRIRTLGKGGFGTVWLAMDNRLGRTVAVKFAHAPDPDTEQRMMREARALAAVHHPNCVRIYDVVTEQEGLGLVMEYIEGSSLTDTVRTSHGIDDVAAARLWVTMAGALDDAHRQGVLHRDVKPSNIILDPHGAPHLIDFGIARSKGDMTLTQSGMMMGTPDFLAPETAAGADASPASDAWQLAATISYALCGRPPRGTRDTPMAALMAAARAERLSELPRGSAHADLLSAALHADPQHRPTLPELRRQLIRWLAVRGYDEDGPVSTVITEPVAQPPRRPR